MVFPELCVTGIYIAGICFTQVCTLQGSKTGICIEITEFTREKDMLVFVGVPLVVDAKLYNVAASSLQGRNPGTDDKDISSELW